jgi:predicted amidohydrolase
MKDRIRIGSYQGKVVESDLTGGLDKIRGILSASAEDGYDFLCFPESFLCGYSERAIQERAIPVNEPELLHFIEWSGRFDTVLIIGFNERKEDGIYNSQIVLHRGRILGIAHKTLLTPYDRRFFRTDLSLPLFEAKGIQFGVVTCHSTSFVEPALHLQLQGARMLFTPHYNCIPPETVMENGRRLTYAGHRDMVLANQAALATLLKVVVVRSNTISIGENGLGSGDSGIWDRDGRQVVCGELFVEGVVSAEFDRNELTSPHPLIDRKEVPIELYRMILEAAIASRTREPEENHP